MSTAKMVADSTVSSDIPGERRKRRKSSESRRSKKPKKSSSKERNKDLMSDDSDSDLDLSKDLLAIGGYIKDRSDMLEQMFSAVRGPSLRRALPDILMDLPVNELKQRCLEQLEIMSRKRILRILAGDIPADISSSGTEDSSGELGGNEEEVVEHDSEASSEQELIEEGSDVEVEDEKGSEDEVEKDDGSEEEGIRDEAEASEEEIDSEAESEEQEESSENGDDQQDENGSGGEEHAESEDAEANDEGEDPDEDVGDRDSVASECHKEDARSDISECETNSAAGTKDDSVTESGIKSPEISSSPKEASPVVRAPALTKEQMEILELEMRARAIKAMLNKHPQTLIPLIPTADSAPSMEAYEDTQVTDRNNASKVHKSKHSKDKIAATIVKHKGNKKIKDTSNSGTAFCSRMLSLPESASSCGDVSHKRVSKDEEDTGANPQNIDNVAVKLESEEGELSSDEVSSDPIVQDAANSPISDKEENEPSVHSSTVT